MGTTGGGRHGAGLIYGVKYNKTIMATKQEVLQSKTELQKDRRSYRLDDKAFEEYKEFLSDPDKKKFCYRNDLQFYIEVTELENGQLSSIMGRIFTGYKTDDETMKHYQEKFNLQEDEIERFKAFLIDKNQKCFIRNHEQILKESFGYLGRFFY